MEKNDFNLNSDKEIKEGISSRMGIFMTISLFLTGLFTISGVLFTFNGIRKQYWNDIGLIRFAHQELLYLCVLCALITLIKIAIDGKPFSNTVVYAVGIIGLLVTISSVVFPRISGYKNSGFELFSWGDFVLIDGTYLMTGLLLLTLACVVKYGLEIQKEVNEIL